MPVIRDPRYSNGLVGDLRSLPAPTAAAERPPLLDTLAAASRQATLPGAAYARWSDPDDDDPAPEGYDPLDDLAGYEEHARAFVQARTPGEVAGIKRRIDMERADRETLTRAGIGGPVAEVTLNLLDPSFLVAVAAPELALAKAGRLANAVRAGKEGAAVAAVYEAGMQEFQETRTATESAVSVGGGALFSGLLGSVLPRRLPAEERALAREAAEAIARPDLRSEAGAAAVARPTTLQREGFAAGADTLLRAAGKVPLAETDLQKIMRSESIEARKLVQQLADVGPVLGKNLEGDLTPTSVEALIVRREGAVADFATELDDQFARYRARELPEGERRLTREQFAEAVSFASRRSDLDQVGEVAAAARFLRARVFDPLKREAQKLGLMPPDAEINLHAESYFRRMYDRNKIRAERPLWDQVLGEHFRAKGMDQAEADSLVDQITARILGADVGIANFNFRVPIRDAGPLHERVLDIDEAHIERFLVNDPLKVADAYVRELAPQIEVTRRFGDKDMADALSKVRDEFAIRRGLAGADAKRLDRVQREQQSTLEALIRIRDRLYSRTSLAPTSQLGRKTVEVLRGWRNLVASAKLGGVAMTGGMMDLSRIVASYGFLPTLTRMAKLASSSEFRNVSKSTARRIGAATEVALARRALVAADGAVTEGWTSKLSDGVYRYSGLNHVTDFLRTLSATLIEDAILRAASLSASRHAVPQAVRTKLASLGIGSDELRRIAAEVRAHGGDVDGMRVSGSASWRDGRLAEIYEAAILKEARTTVLVPGAADRVWWMDSETGRTLGQIKSFVLAAPTRLLATPVQLVGQRQYVHAARFVGSMLVGGYLVHAMRQLAAGKEPATDPKGIAGEAFSESGLAGILPDLTSPIARRFGIFGESARFADRNVTSTLGGPAVGALADAYDITMNRTANGVSARDLHAIRRLAPANQVWWFRRAVNALEGEIAEALGLEGATTSTFAQRWAETTPLRPTAERGGTGTGTIQ